MLKRLFKNFCFHRFRYIYKYTIVKTTINNKKYKYVKLEKTNYKICDKCYKIKEDITFSVNGHTPIITDFNRRNIKMALKLLKVKLKKFYLISDKDYSSFENLLNYGVSELNIPKIPGFGGKIDE